MIEWLLVVCVIIMLNQVVAVSMHVVLAHRNTSVVVHLAVQVVISAIYFSTNKEFGYK